MLLKAGVDFDRSSAKFQYDCETYIAVFIHTSIPPSPHAVYEPQDLSVDYNLIARSGLIASEGGVPFGAILDENEAAVSQQVPNANGIGVSPFQS